MKIVLALVASILVFPTFADSFQTLNLKTELWLEAKPQSPLWGFDFSKKHEGRIYLWWKDGRLGYLSSKNNSPVFLKNAPEVYDSGQGGGMDLRVFQVGSEEWLYVSFSHRDEESGKSSTRLSRLKVEGNRVSEEILYTTKPMVKSSKHFGSRIELNKGGDKVFLSIGDRGERERAQDLSQDYGKVLRLNLDGSVPQDNPFVAKVGASPAIWSYGHRNPQGMARVQDSEDLLLQEHGPRGGDEVNWVRPGVNFGWPIITYGREYWGPSIGEKQKEGLEQPLYHYTPSIAPAGFAVYSGRKKKEWQGALLSGALKARHLNILLPSEEKVLKDMLEASEKRAKFAFREFRALQDLNERIRCVRESPSGEIFVSTDSSKLFRLVLE